MNTRLARCACALGLAALLLTAAGCAQQGVTVELTATPAPSAAAEATPSPEPAQQTAQMATLLPAATPTPAQELKAASPDDIRAELTRAMQALEQPRPMDIAGAGLADPALDVKNLYYKILADLPELRYAYDLTVEAEGDQLNCTVHYMPYKTGQFPEGFAGEAVDSLSALIDLAENNIGEAPVSVRITDPSLDPDEMARALQQVGGGYVLCSLSADATRITFSVPMDCTMAQCLEALAEADRLADEVVASVVTPGMTQRQKAEALYDYAVMNVRYDQRYYADRRSMPYESQTALGALRDNLAICGGYANAMKLLLEKADIPCVNVTGSYFSENHMWNCAYIDGQWLYLDATADCGGLRTRFLLTGDELSALGSHTWKREQAEALTRALSR